MLRIPFYLRKILLFQIFLTTSLSFYFIILKDHLNFADNSNKLTHRRQTHLLDNSCKFAWTEPLDSTLKKYTKFPKNLKCETNTTNIFNRDSATGEFSLISSNISDNLKCVVSELLGGLKPKASRYELGRSETFLPTINNIFWINSNNFYIYCFKDDLKVYQKSFMGLKLKDTDQLYIEGSMNRSELLKRDPTKYSVSMLVFDSTSRAQFSRNMKRTLELMKELGTVVFEAYNKVGDNSAVNMLPILAEELEETLEMNDLDEDGDVNIQKILPSKSKLNPDEIKWIWKQLGNEYKTLFNDDTMHTHRGLFHYPPETFEQGFSKNPTDFYHRPYYLDLYFYLDNLWRKCLHGDLLTEVFIDTWFRFENVFQSVPHFGLNFLASLTHDDPNNLNHLDNIMFDRINRLNQTNSLESTFLIIMGDHGNRIHPLSRYTFAGKIEERAPFLSILMPTKFKNEFPVKAKMLEDNSQRFISNFDLRETLLEILNLKTTGKRKRGRSLFKYQEPVKSCQQNNIISNHCLCMVDAKSDLTVVPVLQDLAQVLKDYLSEKRLSDCFLLETLECDDKYDVAMPNNYIQTWARTKLSQKEVRRMKKKPSPVVYAYINCTIESALSGKIFIQSQIRIVQETQIAKIVYPPKISATGNCSYYSFPADYCSCANYINSS